MLRLYPEQLSAHLDKELRSAYLFLGNDPLLLQESQYMVQQAANMRGFKEHFTIQIDNNNSTDWQKTLSNCQALSLFSSRQILMLTLPENSPNNDTINRHLSALVNLLHDDLLLMMCSNKLTKRQEKATWFTRLAKKAAVLVICYTLNQEQLSVWITERARQHNLQLDKSAKQSLCYYYEGNLLALAQALDRLALLYPDGKLTLPRIKQAVNDASYFAAFHWVDALLVTEEKRAIHILQQLRFKGSEPVILLRALQRELLLLIRLKRQSVTQPLRTLFDEYQIRKNRQAIIAAAVSKFSQNQLRQAIRLLTQAELILKQEHDQSVWDKLESISLLLCHKALADVFVDG